MKTLKIVLFVVNIIIILLLAWGVLSNTLYENALDMAVKNMNSDPAYVDGHDSIDDLRKSWPTIPIEERGGVDPKSAMRIGIARLTYKGSYWTTDKSMFFRIFRTKYRISESKDKSYYIVSMLVDNSKINWKDLFGPYKIRYQIFDFNVAIDKKNGAILHEWAGE